MIVVVVVVVVAVVVIIAVVKPAVVEGAGNGSPRWRFNLFFCLCCRGSSNSRRSTGVSLDLHRVSSSDSSL